MFTHIPRKLILYFVSLYRLFTKLYSTPENYKVVSEFWNMLDYYPMNCKEKRITYHKRAKFPLYMQLRHTGVEVRPHSLNSVFDRRCAVRLTFQPLNAPRKSPQHLLNRMLGGSTATRFWIRQKSLAPAGIVTPDCPTHSLVNIPTKPSKYVSTLNSMFKFSKSPSMVRTALFWAVTQYSLRNSPEECSSHLLRGGSLKSSSSQVSDFKFGFLCYDTGDNRPLKQSEHGSCCFLSLLWILDDWNRPQQCCTEQQN